MKTFYSAIAILSIATLPITSKAQEVFTSSQASQIIKGTEMVRTSQFGSVPSYIKYQTGSKPVALEYIQKIESQLKLGENLDLVLNKELNDDLGFTHYRYKQTYKGIPLEFTHWFVHAKNGTIQSQNGFILQSFTNENNASISSENAITKALKHIDASIYKWQLPSEEAFIKDLEANPEATYYPNPSLVYVVQGTNYSAENYRLAYKMNIYAQEPLSRQTIYVDAISGEIIRSTEEIHHSDSPGTAVTGYSGTHTIVSDSFGTNNYRLRESGRGNGVETYNMQNGTTYGSAVDFTDTDNNWNNVNSQLDQYATDAHWGSEMTYDYYLQDHNRNSIDNNGFALKSFVHFDNGYNNAFWDGSVMTYGDGNGSPLTAIDIAGHEITHGLTSNTADLDYFAESGALNESFSDIFGVAIEHHGRPNNWNWTMGEDLGNAFRSLEDPNSKGDPDTYFGNNWASLSGADQGGVHTNSSVQNYWYYLLSMGGTGVNDNGDSYNVSGIGITDASKVAYRNLTNYLGNTSNFADARFYAIQSAIDLFGACTPKVGSVTNAWYAVGVGVSYYSNTVVSDFTALGAASCEPPLTVSFSNAGINGQSFVWNFGDGSTSTDVNPIHTYTSYGSYNVSLQSNGGTCGTDDSTKVNFVNINDTLPCILTMPTFGIATVQTGCSGKLFDSGGPGGNYGANETSQITISPTNAINVTLNFIDFNIEAGQGSSCNYDYLEVYDGTNTSSTLIGKYCNNNIPSQITSTGSSITIKFYSDGGVEESGFEMDWHCNKNATAPSADFITDATTTCGSVIQFTDISFNLPTSWLWNFGDGQTSTLQNPTHQYVVSGSYNVTLTVTNPYGSSSEIKNSLIQANFVGTPTATSQNICQWVSDTLVTTSPGTSYWYDSLYSSTPVFVGDSFITPTLNATTTFYLEQKPVTSSQFVGPVDNTFGGGSTFSGDQALVFNVTNDIMLESVVVFSTTESTRTVELRNNLGVVINTKNVLIPIGQSTVILNYMIPAGQNYELGVPPVSQPNLYRNNTGTSYPYEIAGLVSITSSTAGSGFYYYYYNWKVKELPCSSNRVGIDAVVNICTGIEEQNADLGLSIFPNPANSDLNISISTNLGTDSKVIIYNAIGQQMYTAPLTNNQNKIDVSQWAKGVYMVKITVDQTTDYKRVVIE